MADLQASIEELWERRDELSPADTDAAKLVEEAIELLDTGQARVAEVDAASDEVVVHEWLKKSILMLFSLRGMETIEAGPFEYADKLPLKHGFAEAGVRALPGASVRWGSFLGRGVVLMPSYVNIGAWVGAGSMVDTWATVASCGQIGERVHLAGGVGIGGVLEPPNAGARRRRGRRVRGQPMHGHGRRPHRQRVGPRRRELSRSVHSGHRRRDRGGDRHAAWSRPGAWPSGPAGDASIPAASSSSRACW